MSSRFVFDAERIGKWVTEKAGGQYQPGNTGIALERDGELVVGIMYDGYTEASISMHSRCDDPKATTREFYRIIFDYPFNQLKVKRATVIVSTANERAQQIDERLGFVREAVLKDYFPDGDAIIYYMNKEQCRWIKRK